MVMMSIMGMGVTVISMIMMIMTMTLMTVRCCRNRYQSLLIQNIHLFDVFCESLTANLDVVHAR